MKLLIISLILVLVVSLSIPTVLATHPDVMTITFDKESYDFGDEVIVNAQLIPPFDSPAKPINIAIITTNTGWLLNPNLTGVSFDEITGNILLDPFFINYTKLDHTQPMTFQGRIVTYTESITPGYPLAFESTHHYGQIYNMTLQSDFESNVMDYTQNREYLKSSIDNLLSSLSNTISLINSLNNQIIQLNNTVIFLQSQIIPDDDDNGYSSIIVTQNAIGEDGKFKFKITSTEVTKRLNLTTINGTFTYAPITISDNITYTILQNKMPKDFDLISSDCVIDGLSVGVTFTPFNDIVYCTFTNTHTG